MVRRQKSGKCRPSDLLGESKVKKDQKSNNFHTLFKVEYSYNKVISSRFLLLESTI